MLRCGTVDDEDLLRQAEQVLTEIKVAQGLSDEHASVLAALRIRLKGKADPTLEEMLETAGDLGGPGNALDEAMSKPQQKRSLDDVLGEPDKPKPDWPG